MENSLRKHILSNYAMTNDVDLLPEIMIDTASSESSDPDELRIVCGEPTVGTENVENTDADELMTFGSTQITKSVESSDPDEFRMKGTTLETRTTETSDPDALHVGSTKQTFIVEASDEDEFLLM